MTTPALAGTQQLGTPDLQRTAAVTRPDDSERGRTSLSDRVVDKTAARAALEVARVHGVSRGIGAAVFNAEPVVGVASRIDGHLAQLRLEVELDYPVSVRAVTRELRMHVSDRVRQLCDITVTDVDVRVTALRYPTEPVRRVL